jgi:hypothetical protein
LTTTPIPSADLDIEGSFSTKSGRTTAPIPSGAEVRFSSGVQPNLQRGLKNVAGLLTTQLKTTSKGKTFHSLILNSTINLALDLQKFSGDYGLYRFTYYEHTDKKKKKTNEILIERLGAIGVEGLTKKQEEAAQEKFNRHHFTFHGTWTIEERQAVLKGVENLSDSLLSLVDGARFSRLHVSAQDPTAAGDYVVEDHTVRLYDLAFKESATRVGTSGGGTYDVAHEIGHAIDERRLRPALQREETARQTLDQRFGRFKTPSGDFAFSNQPMDVVNEFNRLLAAGQAAQRATDAVRTDSGSLFPRTGSTTPVDFKDDPKAGTAFKTAAAGTRVSPYAQDSWMEYFAESFALYTTDPATLARLRPRLFKHFSEKFPKRGDQAAP